MGYSWDRYCLATSPPENLAMDSKKARLFCKQESGTGLWWCWCCRPGGRLCGWCVQSPKILQVFCVWHFWALSRMLITGSSAIFKCKLNWAAPEGTLLTAGMDCMVGRMLWWLLHLLNETAHKPYFFFFIYLLKVVCSILIAQGSCVSICSACCKLSVLDLALWRKTDIRQRGSGTHVDWQDIFSVGKCSVLRHKKG